MARIRTIKPEIATHEGLYDLELETKLPIRFSWCMLFTVCDREGRFPWRPRALKAHILPYDLIEFSRVLDAWLTRGFVVKYRVGKDWYGWIPTFTRHQVINNREALSTLPKVEVAAEVVDHRNQDVAHASSTRGARVDDASGTRGAREGHADTGEGKGKEGKGKEGKGTLSAGDGDQELKLNGSTANGHADLHVEIVELWHELLPSLPGIKDWNERRRRKLNDRIADAARRGKPADTPDYWRTVFAKVARSDLLCGRKTDWRCDLEWLLEPKHFTKFIEGGYDNVERRSA